MRLSAANEVFMKQDFLVGLTDLPHKLHSIPQVSFLSETDVGESSKFQILEQKPKQNSPPSNIFLGFDEAEEMTALRLAAGPDCTPNLCCKRHLVKAFPLTPVVLRQLWFVHFVVGPCLRSLEDTVAKMERLQRTALKSKQDEICIVLEMAVAPSLGRKLPSALEESPLLPERTKSNQGALTCRETLRLLPDGPPEEMAMHLLTVFASYYIRLLVLGQLPKVPARRHTDLGHIPCLCQFIETHVLGKRSLLEMAMHLLTVFASYYIRLLVLGQLPKVPARRHTDLGHIPCLCQFIETHVLGKRS
nr:uncharacterized protein LOC110089874 [Pogona vitticeps]